MEYLYALKEIENEEIYFFDDGSDVLANEFFSVIG
jgi:hypothetical protein